MNNKLPATGHAASTKNGNGSKQLTHNQEQMMYEQSSTMVDPNNNGVMETTSNLSMVFGGRGAAADESMQFASE